MDLDERKQQIFRAIVNAYILTGEPVGSKTLIERESMSVSSATVRNDMSELERLGFLAKTHTSSGRIPSNDGFRYYVATSLPGYDLSEEEHEILSPSFEDCADSDEAIRLAVESIAQFSENAVFALSATPGSRSFQFDVFISGSDKLVLSARDGAGNLMTHPVPFKKALSIESLVLFKNIVTKFLNGYQMTNITETRLSMLEDNVRGYCPECLFLVEELKAFITELKDYRVYVKGVSNLFRFPEFRDFDTAVAMIDKLEEPYSLKEALEPDIYTNTIAIRIGRENTIYDSPRASLISISNNFKTPVVIAVMGPTRMDYSRLISGCNYIISHLGKVLNILGR